MKKVGILPCEGVYLKANLQQQARECRHQFCVLLTGPNGGDMYFNPSTNSGGKYLIKLSLATVAMVTMETWYFELS